MIQLTRKREKALVGLEIEADSIAAAEVRVNGTSTLSTTAIAPLPPGAFIDGEVANPEALAEALSELFSSHKLSKRVRLGVGNQRVVVRTIRLPAIDDPKELDAAVRFQAQEQIPMPIDQVVLDHRVVGGIPATPESPAQIDVVVVAARREMIEASLVPLKKAGLQPVGVDLSAFGLIRALGDSTPAPTLVERGDAAPAPSATLYCNIGEGANLAVARGRACLFTRVAPAGLEGIAASLAGSAGLTLEHARMWVKHVGLSQPVDEIDGDRSVVTAARVAMEAGASSLEDELRLSLDFYGAQEGAIPVDHVVLSGPGSGIAGLPERIEASLGLPLEVGCPQALAGLDPASAARLTLSYGLALDS
ncbi:MAG: type IV pilus assembly protein PilM [Solirubrobacterales bacterium]